MQWLQQMTFDTMQVCSTRSSALVRPALFLLLLLTFWLLPVRLPRVTLMAARCTGMRSWLVSGVPIRWAEFCMASTIMTSLQVRSTSATAAHVLATCPCCLLAVLLLLHMLMQPVCRRVRQDSPLSSRSRGAAEKS